MKVLEAAIPQNHNRYFADLCDALSERCSLLHDHEVFWDARGDFDIVHIHWPEYLSYQIERGVVGGTIDADLLCELKEKLEAWKNKSVVVVTRHNVYPHCNANGSADELYRTVYEHADAVIHMGGYSQREYSERYLEEKFLANQVQALIPHPNYASFPNQVSRKDARSRLGLRNRTKVVLAFGAFKSDDESRLVMDAFQRLGGIDKVLIAPGWREKLPDIKWIRLRNYVRDLNRLYRTIHPQYRFGGQFIPDEDVQYYLNSADVFMIQRWSPLNSGNLVLGFTFANIVVGPDAGNVGEILRATGNPVFEPGNAASAAEALKKALRNSKSELGEANRQFALQHWNLRDIARQHTDLFQELCDRKNSEVKAKAGVAKTSQCRAGDVK